VLDFVSVVVIVIVLLIYFDLVLVLVIVTKISLERVSFFSLRCLYAFILIVSEIYGRKVSKW